MHDDEGFWTPPPNHYGGDDGPILSRRCSCGRLVKLPNEVHVNGHGKIKEKIHCSRCGETDPVFLCWGGDLNDGR